LYLKIKNYKKALNDFEKAFNLDSQKQIGLIGKGDCLRLMEKYEDAKVMYSKALQQKTNGLSILLRRAICNVETKKYDIAL
jgi:tetratricopeptide (TPR) repeat protein